MDANPRCDKCQYWHANDGQMLGYCRLNAPIPDNGNYGSSIWPMTHADDWCGQFIKKLEFK